MKVILSPTTRSFSSPRFYAAETTPEIAFIHRGSLGLDDVFITGPTARSASLLTVTNGASVRSFHKLQAAVSLAAFKLAELWPVRPHRTDCALRIERIVPRGPAQVRISFATCSRSRYGAEVIRIYYTAMAHIVAFDSRKAAGTFHNLIPRWPSAGASSTSTAP